MTIRPAARAIVPIASTSAGRRDASSASGSPTGRSGRSQRTGSATPPPKRGGKARPASSTPPASSPRTCAVARDAPSRSPDPGPRPREHRSPRRRTRGSRGSLRSRPQLLAREHAGGELDGPAPARVSYYGVVHGIQVTGAGLLSVHASAGATPGDTRARGSSDRRQSAHGRSRS